MSEIALNFVTQTHEGRADVVAANAAAIERLYPEGQFFVYDGGLSEASRERLASFDNTVVVDWKRQSDFEANEGPVLARLARLESKLKDNVYLAHVYHEVLGFDFTYSDVIRWDFYMRQKPRSLLDLTDRVEGNVVWLDDDAIVIERFDELFDHEFDVGVTLRSQYDERKQEISALNAGVLFFNCSSGRIRSFVRAWLNRIDGIDLTKHREQIALTDVVKGGNSQIYTEYYATSEITVGDTNLTVRTFPCRRYNYAALPGGIDPSVNKILHFRGSSTLDHDVNMELIDDVRQNVLADWYRGTATEDTEPSHAEPPTAR